MSDTARPGLGDAHDTLRRNRGWFMALGIILLVLGMLAFVNLLIATVVTVYYVGILMLLAGVVQVVHAFRVKGWGGFALWIASGAFYALAGILVIANPLLATTVLTMLIAIVLLVAGILRVVVALRERPRQGWGLVLGTGILSILTGIIILLGWPVNSLWILGMLLAIDLIFQGWGWIAVAQALGGR